MNERTSAPSTEAKPLVARVVDLQKVYLMGNDVRVPALRGVSIDFVQGDFVAIMGASGSGKSTLLNLLGCLDRPTSGRYVLAGNDVSRLGDKALSRIRSRYIGFIFQSYNLISQLNVLQNIELPLAYLRSESPRAVRLVPGAKRNSLPHSPRLPSRDSDSREPAKMGRE